MKAWTLVTVGWLAATSIGCGALSSQPASKIVPIAGFDKIAGEWEGMSKSVLNMRDHAWVALIISQSGHFNFVSDRATGLMLGTGTLSIEDGIVFGKGSAGTGMFTLHDQAGKSVLVADVALLSDGKHYVIAMVPIKKNDSPPSMEGKQLDK
jgi:hypothetical protein